MNDTSGGFNPFDPFGVFSPRGELTVGGLSQPILPGWSVGNVIVNSRNSSSPATEGEIVAEESYGKQIGKLLDAVMALIEQQGGAGKTQAFRDLAALHGRVESIKTRTAAERLAQVRRDLERLRLCDKPAYEREIKALRRLLER